MRSMLVLDIKIANRTVRTLNEYATESRGFCLDGAAVLMMFLSSWSSCFVGVHADALRHKQARQGHQHIQQ